MNFEKKIVCRFPTDHDLTEDRVQDLSDLINAVYDDAESGMWKRQGIRTSPDEVKQLLMEQRLILAEIDGVVVGSVKVDLMGGSIGEFGMLVADVNHRGKGVGSALIKAAEQWAKRMDCDNDAAGTIDAAPLESPEQGVLEEMVSENRL